MKLSILTATYNRGKYLNRLYESISESLKNSRLEVEWIIVDDGSTDNTNVLIKSLQVKSKKNLTIKYIYQENSGKMSAINKGMGKVTGEAVVECDSDDFFATDAIYTIEENLPKLFNHPELYALCFLKKDLQNKISGKMFKENNLKTTMFDLYFKDDIGGEKILVFDSNIRKKYKHEIEKNEKFITESRMYHKMDRLYKILCINEVVEVGEYLKDGYTRNIKNVFKENPRGYYKYFKEILYKPMLIRKKIYVIKHYIYFTIMKKFFS